MLRELDSVREHIQQLHARLLSLTERCAQISPLWQRGERIGRSIPVIALCEYKSKEIHIRQGLTFLINLIHLFMVTFRR